MKKTKISFYVATRDIDCEPHYFETLEKATDYVWRPMGKILIENKDVSSSEINEIYDEFVDPAKTQWELNPPAKYKELCKTLGGWVEFVTCE